MTSIKCNKCERRKSCIDGANHKPAQRCERFVPDYPERWKRRLYRSFTERRKT